MNKHNKDANTKLKRGINMIFPIGGFFAFGSGMGLAGIIFSIVNLVSGAACLLFGYLYALTFLIVLGYIIAALGLIMLIINIISLVRAKKGKPNSVKAAPTKSEPIN